MRLGMRRTDATFIECALFVLVTPLMLPALVVFAFGWVAARTAEMWCKVFVQMVRRNGYYSSVFEE